MNYAKGLKRHIAIILALSMAITMMPYLFFDGIADSFGATSIEFSWPVPGHPVGPDPDQKFGWRLHPTKNIWKHHNGIDIPAATGTSILAAASGKVEQAGWNGGYGYSVTISHGNGYKTLYGHNSKLSVSKGQQVVAGQKIASAGSTGDSTGPHCHFEVILNGVHKNPLDYVSYSTCKNHTWSKTTGVCTKSKCNAKLVDHDKLTTSGVDTVISANNSSRVYKLADDVNTTIRAYPASTAKALEASISPCIQVLGKSKVDSSWYQIYYKNKSEHFAKGYVPSSKVYTYKNESPHSISIEGLIPYTVSKGKGHDISATIKSTYPIYKDKVTFYKYGTSEVVKTDSGKYAHSIYRSALTTNHSSFKKSSDDNIVKKLPSGEYNMVVESTDVFGNKNSKSVILTVNNDVNAPTLNKTINTASGKKIVLKQNESNGVLYYSVDGKSYSSKKLASGSTIEIPITKEGVTKIQTYSTSSSGKKSVVKKLEISISKLDPPALQASQEGRRELVTLSATNAATLKYKIDDGDYIKYTGGLINLDGGSTLKAYASKDGYINSEVLTYTAECVEPSKPEISLVNEDKNIGVGKIATVNWEKDRAAEEYTATLYRKDGENNEVIESVDTTLPTASFKIPDEAEYYISVIASNEIGDSEESNKVDIIGKAPVKVQFRDFGEGENERVILLDLTVPYGDQLEYVVPPEKKGHTFVGWMNKKTGVVSSNEYQSTPITEDTTFVAQYEAKKFNVKIYNIDGSLIETQKVIYNKAVNFKNAEEQVNDTIENAKDEKGNLKYKGYKITGWQVTQTSEGDSEADIEHVDSDMVVRAVANWGNAELPVIVDIESAKIDANGKNVNATLKVYNNNDSDLSFYLIVALKAKDELTGIEKTIYADRKIVYLDANNDSKDSEKTVSMKIRVTGQRVSLIEATAIQCCDDLSTGSAYSRTTKADITKDAGTRLFTDWSDWNSISPPSIDGREIEVGNEYRFRDQEIVTSGKDSLTGYVKIGSETISTTYGKWTTTEPSTSNTVTDACITNVTKETIAGHKSYAYYCDCKKICWSNSGGCCNHCGSKTHNLLTIYSSKGLSSTGYQKDSKDNAYTLPKTIGTSSPGKFGTIYCMYYKGTRTESFTTSSTKGTVFVWASNSTPTKPVYRTKTVKTRNIFSRWGDWSEWSTNEVNSDATREVEVNPTYRYRDEVANEEALPPVTLNEKAYSVSGNLDSIDTNLKGKLATVMVYQANNTDPNKYQMQYLGQIELGDNNSYNFSFVPKEEPSVRTGNYIVALGVQGTTGLITVKVIEAPKLKHIVKFFYKEGDSVHYIGEEQTVIDGHDADMSKVEPPEREGYIFAGWKTRTTNITSEKDGDTIEIEAIYVPIKDTVIFVDWINHSLETQQAYTGTEIMTPGEIEETEGRTFLGWKLSDGTIVNPGESITVTGNMVLEAEFELQEYTVTFVDYDGSTIDVQKVEYGKAAMPPKYEGDANGGTFESWSTFNNWWSVSEDTEVRPIISYSDTAAKPSITIAHDENDNPVISIESELEDAEIYYTTNGVEPTIDMIEGFIASGNSVENGGILKYESDLTFEEDTDVKAVVYQPSMNVSEVTEKQITLSEDSGDEESIGSELNEIANESIRVAPGKDVEINVSLESNPGLMAYDILISGDKDVFYSDINEYDEPEMQQGSLSENGRFITKGTESGWEAIWTDSVESTKKGDLLSLTLHVNEDVEASESSIYVYYIPDNTYNEDYDEVALEDVNIKVKSQAVKDITELEAKLSRTTYKFDGTACEPVVTIEGLREGENFSVEYQANTNAGKGKAIIKGINDYSGTIEKDFTIEPIGISQLNIGQLSSFDYSGKNINPSIGISFNGLELVKDLDYSLSYEKNTKDVGTHAVTILCEGNYTGSQVVKYKVNPKGTKVTSLVKAKKAFTVKWSKQSAKMSTSRITGYQIQYSTSSKFAFGNKTVKVKGYAKTSKKISKLKAKKKYYVRVRTYKTVSGATYYSGWSKSKAITTK